LRHPIFRASFDPGELVVDNFAGGGGASTGIETAIGRSPDIAINHSPEAIAMHSANHRATRHYCESIWEVDPREVCAGRPVGLAWFSPDCTHFSRAKGTQPRKQEIRGLAWVVIRWAETVRPRVICLENVEEFQTWGPLLADGRPDTSQAGTEFRAWLGALTALGYKVEFRSLVAADYGTPTTRRRLFLVARCDGQPIIWPDVTHGKGLSPWRPAAEVIDWSLECPSIFERSRPLAEATLRRIAAGIQRYVVDSPAPFIVRHGHYSTITGAGLREGCGAGTFRGQPLSTPLATVCATNDKHLVCPVIVRHFGGARPSVSRGIGEPLPTVTAKDHHSLAAAFLTKFYGTSTGSAAQLPLPTVTANKRGGGHLAEVRAFLIKYYGAQQGQQQRLFDPLHTVTTKARFGLVMIHGEAYEIADIGMRMLQPRELFAAQGFPADYRIDPEFNGKPLTKTAQTSLAGNSVCPQVAAALVASNVYPARAAA